MAPQRVKLWKCPECGRNFAKKNQAHSCRAHTIDHHFRDKNPELRQIYELLLTRLRELGPLRVDAVQSSINLVSKYHFGGISVRKEHLRLGFLSDGVIDDERVVRAQKQGPNRVSHWVMLRSPDDVDAKLLGWLQKAYALQSR